MSFATLYRISFYVMLFLATLALNIDAGADYPLAPLYPLAVAVAGIVALLTVDRHPARGLPRDVANLLAIGSIAPSLFEYWYDPYLMVLAMGHWLVFLQLIKMFLPKTVEDDWFLFVLGLTQVVVGAFLPGERIGVVIILWAICSLWTLGLFYLRREAMRPAVGGAPLARVVPAPNPKDPYPGLVDFSFLYSAAKVAFLTLALGGLIFLLMPRWDGLSRNKRNTNTGGGSHLTGFSDTVRLGQMGEILESEDVVMSIEFYDALNNRTEPPAEPLWRGVSLQLYENGGWFRQNPEPLQLDADEFQPPIPRQPIKQRIRLESTANEILFALRPIVRADGPDLLLNRRDGTLYRGDLRPRVGYLLPYNRHPGAFEYTVVSDTDPTALQKYEQLDFVRDLASNLLGVPDDLRPRIEPIVSPLIATIPEDDMEGRARVLEAHLRDSGLFTYSLNMQVADPTIDPIDDFLTNRKNGHCEYFASALAMMLRVAGIPSRVVNGFKGGDWNDLGQVMVVRKKHAHSWVEALVGRERATGRPIWISLDGTPSEERDQVIAQVGGSGKDFRKFSDYLRYLWVFYVVGFDSERQNRAIYEPIKNLAQEARRGFQLMAINLRSFLRSLLNFPSTGSFFSLRGFIVSFGGLLLLVLAYRLLRSLLRLLLRPWRRRDDENLDRYSAVACYRRLVQILAEIGLNRPPAETPREFATRSGAVLASRGPQTRSFADLPAQIVDVFYQIRFGARSLPKEKLTQLEDQLDALEAGLRPQA